MWKPEDHSTSVDFVFAQTNIDTCSCLRVGFGRSIPSAVSGISPNIRFEHPVMVSGFSMHPNVCFPPHILFVFASQHLLSSLPPRFTGDRLFFSSNNSVFKKSDLLFSPPDSARFELLMSRFSLPPGSFGNSWPQSGPISMHEALHPKLVSLEQLSALEGFVNSACGGFTTPDDVNQASVS